MNGQKIGMFIKNPKNFSYFFKKFKKFFYFSYELLNDCQHAAQKQPI